MPITASKYIVSGGNFRKTLDFRTLVIRDWEFQVVEARLWFIRSSDNLLRKTNSNKKNECDYRKTIWKAKRQVNWDTKSVYIILFE